MNMLMSDVLSGDTCSSCAHVTLKYHLTFLGFTDSVSLYGISPDAAESTRNTAQKNEHNVSINKVLCLKAFTKVILAPFTCG